MMVMVVVGFARGQGKRVVGGWAVWGALRKGHRLTAI